MSDLLDTPSMEANRRVNVVAVEFWTDYVTDAGTTTARDMVKWAKRGDLTNYAAVEAIDRLRRPMKEMDGDQPRQNPVWVALKPAYDRWKAGQEMVAEGTALEAWAAVGKGQIKVLRAAQIRSVEDLAAIPDRDLGNIRLPDARKLRDLAVVFLANRAGSAELAQAMATRDAEAERLRAELAEMREMIAAQAAMQKPAPAGQPRSR